MGAATLAAYLLAGSLVYQPGLLLTERPELTAHVSVGYMRPFVEGGPYFYKVSGGAWSDRGHSVHLASLFALETGVRVGERRGIYFTASTGAARIGQTNSQVSTRFQFIQGASFGWTDSAGAGMGVYFRHLSNAGLKLPNFGINTAGVEVVLPLSY